MIPDHLKFGGGYDATHLHPVVLVAMLAGIVLLLFLRRKYCVVPLLVLAFLVPYGQQVFVAGQHFPVLRILILAGVVRVLVFRRGPLDPIDKMFILWAVLRALAFSILFMEAAAIVNQVGFLIDYLGAFFLLRFLIEDRADIRRAIRTLAVVAAILALGMLTERTRQINPFGFIGGVLVPAIRDGSIRAQGPFAHPLLAGTFGATLVPLFIWLWMGGKSRGLAITGLVASTAIALTSATSTSVLAYGAGVFGVLLWPVRNDLRFFRRGLVVTLTVLHLAMKAPVWFLVARVDLVGGSSGYHRAMLIDQFITHFFDWWLIGTNDNGNWGFDMWDTCNQFVTEGYTGGLMTFVCFIALLTMCFRRLAAARRSVSHSRDLEWFYWLLGVTVFSHVVAFFGIVYFDQTRILWFALLAMITAATRIPAAETPAPAKRVVKDDSAWFGSGRDEPRDDGFFQEYARAGRAHSNASVR